MRVRFAPSPTGTLHIGSARTALYNLLLARHAGGSFILRIDDTDAARSDAALEASIMADLRWLGLTWDEGPDVGGPAGPYRQSERLGRHRVAAGEAARGRARVPLLLPAGAPRGAATRGAGGGADAALRPPLPRLTPEEVRRRLEAGEPAAVRFLVPAGEVVVDDLIRGPVAIGSDALSDPIIVRSDGVAGYDFASSSTIARWGSRTSSAATTTSRTALASSCSSRRSAAPPRFAHHSRCSGRTAAS